MLRSQKLESNSVREANITRGEVLAAASVFSAPRAVAAALSCSALG